MADWFTGGVTLLALVAAVWAGRAAYGQLQVVQQEAEARRRDSRERQARLVTVTEESLGGDKYVAVVHNRSTEPITSAELMFVGTNNENRIHIGDLPPHSSTPLQATTELINQGRKVLLDQMPEQLREYMSGLISFHYSLLFTDAQRVRWQRMSDQSLIERTPDFDSDAALQAVVMYAKPSAH